MLKVFQRTCNDCMRASYATLFGLKYEDVPDFSDEATWQDMALAFYKDHGIKYRGYRLPPFDLSQEPSIDGYFDATVISPRGLRHAVICDENLNIVHDPGNYGTEQEIIEVWILERV